jgi:flavin-dependent dehydrogenase
MEARHWGGYGLFSMPKSASRDGSLWIGEAAGFQDILFGFGIRNALVSAKPAAQSIIENRSYDDLYLLASSLESDACQPNYLPGAR